jgi:type II secretory pathway pseudopilin PulG
MRRHFGRRTRGEAGETLAEILVSTTILGIVGVGIIGAIASVLTSTDVDRAASRAETVLRSYAAAVQDAPYSSCAEADAYEPAAVDFEIPSRFTAAVTEVAYWTGAGPTLVPPADGQIGFDGSCEEDRGLQRVGLQVSNTTGSTTEHIVIFKRGDPGSAA